MNNTRIHNEIEDWMAGALCDALDPAELQAFEHHIEHCPECRALFEEDQKMNTLLKNTLQEFSPDSNFERRILEGFRKKTARNRFRLTHWLALFASFRPVQAACAVLLLAAMVKSGSLLTGERFPVRNPISKNRLETSLHDHFTRNEEEKTTAPSPMLFSNRNDESGAVKHGEPGSDKSGIASGKAASDVQTRNFTQSETENEERPEPASAAETSSKSITQSPAPSVTTAPAPATDLPVNGATFGLAADQSASAKGGAGSGKRLPGNHTFTGGTGIATDQLVTSAGSATFSLKKSKPQTGAQLLSGLATDLPSAPGAKPAVRQAGVIASLPLAADRLKLIRNASLEIEVADFEKAAGTITAIALEESGSIATQNSDRGTNGKLQGTIVVKVPPPNLDRFLQKLRALGSLKNQTLGVEDVSKAYLDTDARLRNSKRMEERLLDMLKKNTGKVSDLLQVEKELARIREQIEEMQGELKHYDSLVVDATVTLSLCEKDLNQPAAYRLQEHANLSLFVRDVEQAFAAAKSGAESVRAQTVESHIEHSPDGRISATLRLLFVPETADSAIAKMKTLGRIQHFNSQTERVARDGSGDSDSAKIERDKVELNLVIMRDEESAAQQTALGILTDRVEEKTARIKQAAATAGVEVKNATFNRSSNGMEISVLTFRMPLQKYTVFLEQIQSLGNVKNFTVSRHDDNATENAPAEISLRIYSRGNLVADETGLPATLRTTLAQGFGALMWSARMTGVTLAFVAPWALTLGVITWLMLRRREKK